MHVCIPKPTERGQRHGEIVGQIRHGQRVGAQDLAADRYRLPLKGFCLGVLLQDAEQRSVIVHQLDGSGMMALGRVVKNRQRLLIQLSRPFQVAAPSVVFGKRARTHGNVWAIWRQHSSPDFKGFRKESLTRFEILTFDERSKGKNSARAVFSCSSP